MKSVYQIVFTICLLFTSCFTFSQVPVYNSYPSAAATIYLDFDGHLVENTAWNWNGPINCAPANVTNEQIKEIFNRVAEDYRPFNVNITTDSTVYWSAPILKRMRVILTTSSSWYGSAGGVSYIGSFTWGDNTPCFVFTALLGYNTKNLAEAASHEVGHTLGLRHQSAYDDNCVKTSEYNPGIGSGEIAWAPIMGVGYYRNLTLWNYGANPFGCSVYQDDLSIITSANNGFGFRSDDHASTPGAATLTNFTDNEFVVQGVIERIDDKDYFQFNMPASGQFHLEAIPYNIGTGNDGSNLDMQVTLRNSANTIIGVYNPQTRLDADIDTLLNAGTYYISVEPKGNIYAPEYATLGSYSLRGSYMPFAALPLRQLELKGKKNRGEHQFSWIIEADEAVVEQVLEMAATGNDFQTIGVLSPNARSWNYVPKEKGLLRYRVHVTFDNGKHYYSNIIGLNNEGSGRPVLLGNSTAHTLLVSSPSEYFYEIHDFSGRLMSKGRLTAGSNQLNVGQFSNGLYLIRFSDNGGSYQEKFLKH